MRNRAALQALPQMGDAMRFRLRKRYQVLAAVLAVAALWTMGIWPFGGAAPVGVRE